MKLYRILTENKNRKKIINLIKDDIPSFTVLSGIGVWHGNQELSLCIEIAVQKEEDERLYPVIYRLCRAICVENKQAIVLLQTIPIICTAISQSGIVEAEG